MPDPFRKVNPGDPVEFTAVAWNAMLDAARSSQFRTGGDAAPIPRRQATIVNVTNGTGSDLNRNSVVGLDGPIFTPEQSEDAFLREVAFRAITPDIDLHKRRYAVLLDAIPADQVGRAYLSGVCQVRVDLIDPSHEFARIVDMDSAKLESSRFGHAQILWTEADGAYYGYDTGVMWAIVRLGVTMSCIAIGIANGGISPRVGDTFGTGEVFLYRSLAGDMDGPIETIEVLNASADTIGYGDSIEDGTWVSVAWDADDIAWVAPLECQPGGAYM
jgi:hypothetical protein